MKSFKELTAPGYFAFGKTQSAYTKKLIAWFEAVEQKWDDQINLFDSFFRLWATRDYSGATISRTPYIAYLLQQNGIDWFNGNDTQAVALISIASRSYDNSTARNIFSLFSLIAATPFFWSIGLPQIIYGTQQPAIFAESLVIFSTAGSLPATPAPTVYTERAWTAPGGWAKFPVSATFYSYGYLSGGNIVWMTPQDITVAKTHYDVANLAGLPAAGTAGNTAGVFDDSTGDQGAEYYDDGATWRKTSTPNANQGTVAGGIPDPLPSAVIAPDSVMTSEQQPPPSDPSQGYGMYGNLYGSVIPSNEIDVAIVLTSDGISNLGIIINLMRRIKPSLNKFILIYSLQGNDTQYSVEIKDAGAIA